MTSAPLQLMRLGAMLGVVVLAVGVGAGVSRSPDLAMAMCVLPAVAGLLVSSTIRLLVVTVGALVVFQSSSAVSELKAAYFVLFVIALFGSIMALARGGALGPQGPLVAVACVFLALSVLSLAVALVYATPIIEWSRDVFPYLMCGAAPLFALDFARAHSRAVLTAVYIAVGAAATISFFFTWIERRGTGLVDAEQLGFSSFLLAASLVTYAATRTVWPDERRVVWASVGAASFLALMATGTRSSLVVVVGSGVALLLAPTTRRARFAGAGALSLAVVAIGLLGLKGGFAQSVVNVEGTEQRLSTFVSAVSDPGSDQSLALRQEQTRAAMDVFLSAPFTGMGPGHPIVWSAGAGFSGTGYFVDSPAGFLAKFGLLGVLALLITSIAMTRFLILVHARAGPSGLALIAFLATVIVWSTLGTPFDDKGLPIALIFLVALTVQEHEERGTVL